MSPERWVGVVGVVLGAGSIAILWCCCVVGARSERRAARMRDDVLAARRAARTSGFVSREFQRDRLHQARTRSGQ